jgi:hypothetical protein
MIRKVALIISICLMAFYASAEEQNPSTGEFVYDWGIFTEAENGGVIDVGRILTTGKIALTPFFTSDSFEKITKSATDEAKKLLRVLWDIPEISNMRFSSYQIILIKPRLVEWDESLRDKINSAMSGWWDVANK